MAFSKRSKGQSALEYMVVISFALLLAAPVIMRAQTSTSNLKDSKRLATAKNSLNKIQDASELVYSQGPPSQLTFSIEVPSRVVNTTVSEEQISMRLKAYNGVTDIYNIMEINVSGNIPESQGVYKMKAKAYQNYVNISKVS